MHKAKVLVEDRVHTQALLRVGRRLSEDNSPPLPSLPGTNSHNLTPLNQSSHAGGYVHGYRHVRSLTVGVSFLDPDTTVRPRVDLLSITPGPTRMMEATCEG